MSDLHRKQRLAHLIATDFGGRQDSFVQKSGRGKGRVSQMLGAEHPFGEKAARLLAEDVGLHPDWFNNSWPTPNEAAQGVRIEGDVTPGQVDAPKHPAPAVSASELLMQLAHILETLTPGARGAAASLIAEAIQTPGLAASNAAKLDGMLTPKDVIEDLPAVPTSRDPMQMLLAQKQTPHAFIPGAGEARRKKGA